MSLLFVKATDVKETGLQLSPAASCSIIPGLHRTAERLFHSDGPTTAKLRWSIVV